MALINNLGRYIKLDKDGSFEIYISEEARLKLKASTPAEVILEKYREILRELRSPNSSYAELRHYNPQEYQKILSEWSTEYTKYELQLIQGTFDKLATYPKMSEYYPDIIDSIPKVIARGSVGPAANTTEEVYEFAKQDKTWGETTDA